MNILRKDSKKGLMIMLACIAVFGTACAVMPTSGEIKVTLSGAQEVPPVTTSASGSGTVTIGTDKSVTGGIATTGIVATAAHIHDAAMGENGPVIVPMIRAGDNAWSFAAGAKLSDAQYQRLMDGKLYINIHSAAHKGGEIRGQLKP